MYTRLTDKSGYSLFWFPGRLEPEQVLEKLSQVFPSTQYDFKLEENLESIPEQHWIEFVNKQSNETDEFLFIKYDEEES